MWEATTNSAMEVGPRANVIDVRVRHVEDGDSVRVGWFSVGQLEALEAKLRDDGIGYIDGRDPVRFDSTQWVVDSSADEAYYEILFR